jgi:hypothetical protein
VDIGPQVALPGKSVNRESLGNAGCPGGRGVHAVRVACAITASVVRLPSHVRREREWLGHGFVPPSLLLLGTVASVAIFVLRRPRDYGDLLIAGAGALIAFYLFAKQAFLNYDYNAAMALLFVIAGGSLRPSGPLTSLVRDAVRLVSGRRRAGAAATDLEVGSQIPDTGVNAPGASLN